MKRLICLTTMLVLLLCGCSESVTQLSRTPEALSTTQNEKVSINTADFAPVLFYDSGSQRNHALILCGFENGEFRNMSDYTYNERSWNDFADGKLTESVHADFVKTCEDMVFYNSKREHTETKIKSVSCVGRAIDEFTEIHVELDPVPPVNSGRQIGICSAQESYPEIVKYSDTCIDTDLDGNDVIDKISWSFEKDKANLDGDYFNFSVVINLNGKTFLYNNESGYPLKKEDLTVFVADLNADGIMEVIIYEKLFSLMSSVLVYQVADGQITPLLNYTLNPGP